MFETHLFYCDDALNLTVGCLGCELARPTLRPDQWICYAATSYLTLTRPVARSLNLPETFWTPKFLPERLAAALELPDRTGTKRPEKPWLDGLPRICLISDMGDPFAVDNLHNSPPAPVRWLFDNVQALADAPCIWLFLTRYPSKMNWVWKKIGAVPDNCWLGVSISRENNYRRLELLGESNARHTWVAFEPVLGNLPAAGIQVEGLIDWAVIGGLAHPRFQSKAGWLDDLLAQLTERNIPVCMDRAKGPHDMPPEMSLHKKEAE